MTPEPTGVDVEALRLPLSMWVRERLDNCQRLAARKFGTDRAGWMEDASYFTAILSALSSAERASRLEAALREAAYWFEDYAHQHAAKNTDDGDRKATVNFERAASCRQALATPEPK